MRLIITAIKDIRGGSVRDSTDGLLELALPGEVRLDGLIHVEAEAVHAGETFHVTGTVRGRLKAVCDRCLMEFSPQMEALFEADFRRIAAGRPGTPAAAPRRDDETAEEEIHEFRGEEIDLTPLIEEAILLAIPMKLLCRPDCEGICPQCGLLKAGGQCQCVEENFNPKFDALRKLLGQEEV